MTEKFIDRLLVARAAQVFHLPVRHVWSEELQKFDHVTAHHGILAVTDPRRAAREQSFGVDNLQVFPVGAVGRHAGNDAYTKAHANVGLDHVGVSGSKPDVWLESRVGKGALKG